MQERRISIAASDQRLTAVLGDTATADAVWSALPIEAPANTWGDEIYFDTSVQAEEESDSREVVDLGDIGYWPPGPSLCLFFGPTPMRRGDEIRPASAVNVIGKIDGDPTVLKRVRAGERVVIERA